ncbi:hypothetical protein Tco_0600035 [Tanacetum coccineum]|uniref:Zinc finger, CCHC-type n=1 Tax=Tanacetum coccineum TaxID=301880 RepID=A0ABQ4WAL6_9ASTR
MVQTILKSHVEKPEKFKGSDFLHWQQKMLFYLTSLHVSYFLMDSEPKNPYLVDGDNVTTEAQTADYEKPVVKQVEELQIIVHEMEVEGIDNRMNEKADVNSLAPNANMVRESFSKSKSNHKNKSKNGGGSGQKHSKDGKKDYN